MNLYSFLEEQTNKFCIDCNLKLQTKIQSNGNILNIQKDKDSFILNNEIIIRQDYIGFISKNELGLYLLDSGQLRIYLINFCGCFKYQYEYFILQKNINPIIDYIEYCYYDNIVIYKNNLIEISNPLKLTKKEMKYKINNEEEFKIFIKRYFDNLIFE